MRLRIITPMAVVLDESGLRSLRAEDASGSFGVLPGHAPFLTSLTISILHFASADGRPGYCAVRRGILKVDPGGDVLVTTREAVLGAELNRLADDVLAGMTADQELERTERAEAMRLELGAIRQIIRRMRGRTGSEQQAGLS